MQFYPLLFQPNLRTVIWGGNQLRPYKGHEPSDEPIGESWEVSAVPSSSSIISYGEWAGRNINIVIREYPKQILGKKVNQAFHGQLPLLAKFIDPGMAGDRYLLSNIAMNKRASHTNGEYLLFLNSIDSLFDELVLQKVSD